MGWKMPPAVLMARGKFSRKRGIDVDAIETYKDTDVANVTSDVANVTTAPYHRRHIIYSSISFFSNIFHHNKQTLSI